MSRAQRSTKGAKENDDEIHNYSCSARMFHCISEETTGERQQS